jgi:hypothetical protein
MSWSPAVNSQSIHDYEVGLSSTQNSISPDVVSFRSSKHHNHIRLNHPDIPDGKEFYAIFDIRILMTPLVSSNSSHKR